jgi:cell division protease FtsH
LKGKKSNEFIIYIIFVLLIIFIPFLFFKGEKKEVVKYYQIVDYFRKDRVVGFDIKLGSGDLTVAVEKTQARTIDVLCNLPTLSLLIETPDTAFNQASAIIHLFKNDCVSDITFLPNNKAKLKVIVDPATVTEVKYKLPSVKLFLADVNEYIKAHDNAHPDNVIQADYKRASNSWGTFIAVFINSVMPLILIGVAIYFMQRYMSKGSIGQDMGGFKSKHIKYLDKGPKILMSDVAALNEEKEEIADLIQFLKDPNKFSELGAKIPTGVLLVGPPGTGKTLLARALAGEAGVPFFFISGSAFVEVFVGVGASRVRDLFEIAKKHSPCIVFIDEIDAVGKQREVGSFSSHDERDQTLNQLLVEMDGFKPNSGVIVVAATNMAKSLDKALLRPGRFDRQIYIGHPDVKGREEILTVHTKNKPLAPDVNLEAVAKATIGFTGADLANLMNEAALLAAKYGKKSIRAKDIDRAVVKVIVGTEKRTKKVTANNRYSTAIHEAGHAICAYYCENYSDVNMISIIPTGNAGGFTLSTPKEDNLYKTDAAMRDEIVVAMGGRAAEKLELDEISTGAMEDIRVATINARSMVTIYGFSTELGNVVYDNAILGVSGYMDPLAHSNEIMQKIDEQIRKIIDTAYEKAVNILTKNRTKLMQLVQYLLDHEKIDAAGFTKMMAEPDMASN